MLYIQAGPVWARPGGLIITVGCGSPRVVPAGARGAGCLLNPTPAR